MPVITLEAAYATDLRVRLTTGPTDEAGETLFSLIVEQGPEHLGPNLQIHGLAAAQVRALRDACSNAMILLAPREKV